MENPIKMDDLGVPLFLETSIWVQKNGIQFGESFPWILRLFDAWEKVSTTNSPVLVIFHGEEFNPTGSQS